VGAIISPCSQRSARNRATRRHYYFYY